jgi:acyl carrier protein
MPHTRDRLIKCFQAVFPVVTGVQVVRLSSTETPTWDSLAMVNLIALIEDEFVLHIPIDDYDEMNSFESIYVYVKKSEGG